MSEAPNPDKDTTPAAPPAQQAGTPEKAKRQEGFKASFAEMLKSKGKPVPEAAKQTEAPAPTAAPPAPEAPKQDLVSPKLAELQRRERETLQREAALKEKESRLKEVDELEALRRKGDIDGALRRLGLTSEQVVDYLANQKRVTPELETKLLEERVQAMLQPVLEKHKQLDSEAKANAEAQKQRALSEATAAFQSDILKAAAGKLEYVAALPDEAGPLAISILQRELHARQQQAGRALFESELPTVEWVAAETEKALEEAYTKRQAALLTVNKFKSKLGGVVSQPAAPTAASESGPTRAARTLSNSSVAAPPANRTPTTPGARRAGFAEAFAKAKANRGR